MQVPPRHSMAVIPPRAGRTRSERIAAVPVCRNRRRALFLRAVDIGRDVKPMPVNQRMFAGIVKHIDDNRLSFARAQKRSRRLAVVARVLTEWRGASSRVTSPIRSVMSATRPSTSGAVTPEEDWLEPSAAADIQQPVSDKSIPAGHDLAESTPCAQPPRSSLKSHSVRL